MPEPTALTGLKVLVVEDSYLIAEQICSLLARHGCEVVGPVGAVTQGVRLAEAEELDGALLDINLHGEFCYPIAAALAKRHVPFVFLSGYGGSNVIPEDFAGAALLGKPPGEDELLDAVKIAFVR